MIYDVKKAEIDNKIKKLQANIEKYKTILTRQKKYYKSNVYGRNSLNIFEKASPSNQNKLLRALISDCKLNSEILEYTINKPFDMLVKCPTPKSWLSLILGNLNKFSMVKV